MDRWRPCLRFRSGKLCGERHRWIMRVVCISLLTFLTAAPAFAQSAVMNKNAIACWHYRDFMALVAGEHRGNYWWSHQQKRDYMAQGRCFALRKGERVTVERVMKSPYVRLARLRKPDDSRSFWTDQGFDRQ